MADTKIEDLTDGITANGTDWLPVSRSPYGTGNNRKIAVSYIDTYVKGLAHTWTQKQTFTPPADTEAIEIIGDSDSVLLALSFPPTDPANGPFGFTGVTGADINTGTDRLDDTWRFGYNMNTAGGKSKAGEAVMSWNFESHYELIGEAHAPFMEMHMSADNNAGDTNVRAIFMQFRKLNAALEQFVLSAPLVDDGLRIAPNYDDASSFFAFVPKAAPQIRIHGNSKSWYFAHRADIDYGGADSNSLNIYDHSFNVVASFHQGFGVGFGVDKPTAYADCAASTTARASLRIRSGTAPTSPNSGDLWYDGTNLKFRDGSTTRTITWT